MKKEDVDLVRSIGIPELLVGLAEEAAELSHAALKMRRVYDGTNPTPVMEDDAMERLYEEVADVALYVRVIQMNQDYIENMIEQKMGRWTQRLNRSKSEKRF